MRKINSWFVWSRAGRSEFIILAMAGLVLVMLSKQVFPLWANLTMGITAYIIAVISMYMLIKRGVPTAVKFIAPLVLMVIGAVSLIRLF